MSTITYRPQFTSVPPRSVPGPSPAQDELPGQQKFVVGLTAFQRGSRPNTGSYREMRHFIGFTNVRELLAKFFLTVHYLNGPVSNWRAWDIGITSYVQRMHPYGQDPRWSNKHMPLLEYDARRTLKTVRADIASAQAKYILGPAWIYKTRRNYQVYFASDFQGFKEYLEMVLQAQCSETFKGAVAANQIGALRVSAEYTDFDITLQEVVAGPNTARPPRKHWLGLIAEELIGLGTSCGTHFASLYPQWARYQEDREPWNPRPMRARLPPAQAGPEVVQKAPSQYYVLSTGTLDKYYGAYTNGPVSDLDNSINIVSNTPPTTTPDTNSVGIPTHTHAAAPASAWNPTAKAKFEEWVAEGKRKEDFYKEFFGFREKRTPRPSPL